MGQLLDIAECAVRASLLLYLCSDMLSWKKRFVKQGKYLFFLLFVIWGFWLGNSKWLNRLLYGEGMGVQKSSPSIVKVGLMMLMIFLLLAFFCEGGKLVKLYLALLYETILEMSKFGVHGFWSLFMDAYNDWQINRMPDDVMALEKYISRMQILGYVWNLLLMVFYFTAAYIAIRAVLKYRQGAGDIDRQGTLFLMLSPSVGMAFDVILRCLFFTITENDYEFIYDKHTGMYVIIPVMTFLCLLLIVYNVKIYKELMSAEEEKRNMLFLKQQLVDMTGYVQDMERLYDGIRSMRHDMNNCIADMEQLLLAGIQEKATVESCMVTETLQELSIEKEAAAYLGRMKEALDTLTMRYHTGNPVTDVIMNRKWKECQKEGILLTSDFIYPEQLGIEAFDLGIIMNNALDNAIEACKKCVDQKTQVQVCSYQRGRMFFLRIENDCNTDAISYTEGGALKTTKENEWMHGIGIKNMESIAKRYFGTISYGVEDSAFILTVMLQSQHFS